MPCNNCKYFKLNKLPLGAIHEVGAPKTGLCRRNPPLPYPFPAVDKGGRQQVVIQSFYPVVLDNDPGCGEFAPVDSSVN